MKDYKEKYKKAKCYKKDELPALTGLKAVALFVEDADNDILVAVRGQVYNKTSWEVADDHPDLFFMMQDDDGVWDLCMWIDDTQAFVTATFKRPDTTVYQVQSVDFIGGRPPSR